MSVVAVAASLLSFSQLLRASKAIRAPSPPLSALPKRILAVRGGSLSSAATGTMQDETNFDVGNVDDHDPWNTIGGGAINEKQRRQHYPKDTTNVVPHQPPAASSPPSSSSHFDPSHSKSHLWHALEGLDRYPNYLSRWPVDDMDSLEHALQEQITKVRQQRSAVVERRKGIQNLVQDFVSSTSDSMTRRQWEKLLKPPTSWQEVRDGILDPAASKAIFSSQVFAGNRTKKKSPAPTVSQVLAGEADIDLDASQLAVLMDEEMFDVFSFRLLSLTFCRQVREFVSALVQFGQESPQHASLLVGRRPVDLDTVGLEWINNLLFHLIVRPVSRQLFQSSETGGGELDWRQGYIAGYSARPAAGKPRERLVTHTDDSEVTLNVCLGDEGFEGGLLEFRGLRGNNNSGAELMGTFSPQPGLALLHAGRHFHHVTTVTSGDRFAYIIWARSWQGIRSQECPCCWLNRRQDKTCICGERWN